MGRGFIWFVAAYGVSVIGVAGACTTQVHFSDDDGASGGGGQGGAASSSTADGAGPGNGGSGLGPGVGGAGLGPGQGGSGLGPGVGGSGGSNCISCSDYLLNGTGAFEDLCGYDPNQFDCNNNPNSSCNLLLTLGVCICGDFNMPGMCTSLCQQSCTGMGQDAPNCNTCVTTNCSAEANDCLADPGTT